MIKKIGLFFFCVFAVYSVAFGQYSNPELKVLLLKTSSSVDIRGSYSLQFEGNRFEAGDRKRIIIKPIDSNHFRINNQTVHKGSLIINSFGPIKVAKKGASSHRGYLGRIEVRPYRGGIYVINHIPTETYLEGVLNAEISTNWHIEVVKAQSVIARTFALYKRKSRISSPWHLTATYTDQVYHGNNISDERGRYAIQKTHGMVVSYQGILAQTFYHSNCGGSTEDPGNLWQTSLPYLTIKEVPFGENDPRYHWELVLSDHEMEAIAKKAGLSLYDLRDVYINQRTKSQRAYGLSFVGNQTKHLAASEFRKLTGYRKIQSLLFDLTKIEGGYYIQGKGNGHGVGLCQWAAKEMAETGYSFQDILNFFYTPITIESFDG